MRKILLLVPFFLISLYTQAQYKWDVGGSLGAANYLGDIGGGAGTRRDFVLDMKMGETRTAAGAFARRKLGPKFSLQMGFDYAHIQGDDKLSANPERQHRNLNFQNNIYELNVMGQYFFYEINDLGGSYRYRNDFRAYAGIGVAGFHHNPKTLDTDIPLEPMMNEGHAYSLYQFAIPAQLGFYITIDKRYRIGWDLTWRTTFTDYLDDVSTNYVNPATKSKSDPQYANFLYYNNRTPELSNVSAADAAAYGYHTYTDSKGGTHVNKRGDPSHNDSYMTSTINFSYTLRGKSTFYKSNYGSIFKSKKHKKRKFRAKF